MSTIRPVAPAPVVARSVRVSDKPVPKAVSPKLPLAAQAQMDRERPKFKTPEDYKNYVIKFAGYKRVAQQDVQAAQTELEQVQALMQTAEADYRRPLEAARADLDHARTLYQGPVDQAKHDRDEATTALDLALYPGKPHATQLEAEAARTAEAIKDLEGKLAAGQDRLGKLDGLAADARARQQTAAATQADAKEQIKRLEESLRATPASRRSAPRCSRPWRPRAGTWTPPRRTSPACKPRTRTARPTSTAAPASWPAARPSWKAACRMPRPARPWWSARSPTRPAAATRPPAPPAARAMPPTACASKLRPTA